MQLRFLSNVILFALAGGWAPIVAAQEADAEARDFPLDPVHLVQGEEVEGKDDVAIAHAGFLYHFASEENKAAFEREPARYEIQMGGACANMGELSGNGRTDLHAVWDEHTYLFASPGCRERFLSSPERLVLRPDPAPAVDDASAARGREILDRALEALGGAERVDSIAIYHEVRNWLQESGGTMYQRRETLAFEFPDSLTTLGEWNEWKSGCAFDGETAWFVNGEGRRTLMEPARRDYLSRTLLQHPLSILRHRNDPDIIIVHAGDENLALADGSTTMVDLVAASGEGVTTTLGIERSTGRILLSRYRSRGPGAYVGGFEATYSDFQEVEGLLLPHHVATTFDGKPAAGQTGPLTIQVSTNPADDSDSRDDSERSSRP